nr:hypothetical protein [Tanacetum cinerariifolium]
MVGVDINTLTMEQYLALSRENQAPCVVKPEIIGNVNFEIKSQFMQELKEDTFFGIKNKDAHDHVDRVLNIVSLFSILGVSLVVVLLRVFPFTLTGEAKRWVDRLTPGVVNTWDLLKNVFIQRNISSSSDTDGLAAVISELDNLGCNIKKLKENAHAIQVRYNQTPFGEKRPNFVETINKCMEGAVKRQAEQDEWLKTFCQNTEKSQIDHDKIIQDLESQEALVHETMKSLKKIKINRPLLKEIRQTDLPEQTINHYVEPYVPLIPFPNRLKQHAEEALVHETMKSLKKIKINRPLLKEIRQTGIGKLEPIDMVIEMVDDTKCIPKGIVKNLLIKIDKFILPIDFVILDIIEDFRMPVILGRPLLVTTHAKVDIFINTISLEVGNEKGTHQDDDNLEGIIDYLEPTLYDGFIDSADEEYKERKCRLLGMPYIKPPPILIEMVKVTRYSIDPGEVYTKIKVSKVEELSRTRRNIANIKAGIMEEILGNDDEKDSYDET